MCFWSFCEALYFSNTTALLFFWQHCSLFYLHSFELSHGNALGQFTKVLFLSAQGRSWWRACGIALSVSSTWTLNAWTWAMRNQWVKHKLMQCVAAPGSSWWKPPVTPGKLLPKKVRVSPTDPAQRDRSPVGATLPSHCWVIWGAELLQGNGECFEVPFLFWMSWRGTEGTQRLPALHFSCAKTQR